MKNLVRRATLVVILVPLVAFVGGVPAMAGEKQNVGNDGIAIKGYDPVAFFAFTDVDSNAVKGKKDLSVKHGGATYLFATKENMEKFKASPDKYVPKYGGFCAYGVALGKLFDIDPNAWTIVEERLYLNKDPNIRKMWKKDTEGNIKKAEANWPNKVSKP